MKEILTEWRKFLIKEETSDLFNFGQSTNQNDIQVYPVIPLSKEQEINLINYFLYRHKEFIMAIIVNPIGDKQYNYDQILNRAVSLLIQPIRNSIEDGKKQTYYKHTTPQSIKAYQDLINKNRKWMSTSKEDQEELDRQYGPNGDFYGAIEANRKKLLSLIPSIIKKIIDETKITLVLDDKTNDMASADQARKNIYIFSYNLLKNASLPIEERRKLIISDLSHEFSHIIDAHIGTFLEYGIYNPSTPTNKELSSMFFNRDEFMKNFYKKKYIYFAKRGIGIYDPKFNQYIFSPTELYTRLKKLQLLINPKTGFVDQASLKRFIQNPNFGANDDVEDLFDLLDFSTDEKINKFVNLLNSVAKANTPQKTQIA